MTFRVISPNRKSTKTTKNKGKAAITAIKYSAFDRAILFSFYNHPQPLWVWVDGISTSPIKLNLHVDVREREKASIKGGRSSPERGLGPGPRIGATQAVPRRKSSWISSVHLCAIIMNTMTNDCPFAKAQPFSPLFTNSLYWARRSKIPPTVWYWAEKRDPTIGAVCGKVCALAQAAVSHGRIKPLLIRVPRRK